MKPSLGVPALQARVLGAFRIAIGLSLLAIVAFSDLLPVPAVLDRPHHFREATSRSFGVRAAGAQKAPAKITTLAGSSAGLSGDGGQAIAAQLREPADVVPMPGGGLLIADRGNHRIRLVTSGGVISTVAGSTTGLAGDGGPATSAQINEPFGVAVTPDGGFLIGDRINARIRRVSPAGIISTAAGTSPGFSGDGGRATAAKLRFPRVISTTIDGGFLFADQENARIRRVSPDGTISTVAGSAIKDFTGDGGPATLARLHSVTGVSATADGGFLIADRNNQRIRRVWPEGTISTVAGNGVKGFGGDGGPATSASLNLPRGVAWTPEGGFVIADTENHRIRRVSADGTITTIAGNGVPGLSGDGGPATAAQLNYPLSVAVTEAGGILIADQDNHRVRLIDVDVRGATPLNTQPPTIAAAAGPRVGVELVPNQGRWSPSPIGYRSRWLRCNADGFSNCIPIMPFRGDVSTYTPTQADVGYTLRICYVATGAGGDSTPVVSATTGVVTASLPKSAPPGAASRPQR